MELETLSCNNCGAPLQVPESANFVSCAHCGSRLAVKRTETAHYTEVLEKLTQRTDQIDSQVRKLQIENDLLRLDQNWEESRRDYMISTRGGKSEPTMGMVFGSLVGAVVLFLVACAFLSSDAASRGDSSSGLALLVVLVGIGISIFAAANAYTKYQEYKQAEASYYETRSDVESRRHSNY